jgi:tripartite-type tricarboxylate transporter receptor subunit TctC
MRTVNRPARPDAPDSPNAPDLSRRTLLAAAGALALAHPLARAQDKYPSRPIEFVVPWGAGGGADQLARRAGKLLESELKVSIPVLNVAGATGNTGTAKMLSAPPDGHTICIFIGDTLASLAGGKGRWKLSDITPLGVMIRQPSGLFVKADARWKNFAELLADARSNELKVGVTGFGSVDEILINQMNAKGHKFRVVPFAAPGERYTSVLGGHADVVIEQAGDVRSFLTNKQMRPLAFFADQPQTGYTDVPLARDSGFPIVISQFRAIVMRAGTDPKHVATLAAAVEKVARSDDFKQYLVDELAFADSYIPAAQSAAFFEGELKRIESNMPAKS